MDEKNILLDKGKYTFLATVFSGRSGKKLYNRSGKALRAVESRYKKLLKNWDGEPAKFKRAKRMIRASIIMDQKK